MLGSLFFCGISILFVGITISFGNRINKVSEQFIEIDKINKEINDGKN